MLYFSTHMEAPDAQKSFIHPYDPAVEKEYETLIKSWKEQLIDKTPRTPSNDYVRLAWMRLIDHYLDQQWLDSKQMLQCAQAWSARDSLSLNEAVHTMNILSLKSMQRSLDARQELLQALGDPEMMVGFGLYEGAGVKQDRFSLTGSDNDDEVHAPLLVRHTYDSLSSASCEEKILEQLQCGINPDACTRYSDDDDDDDQDIADETEAILATYRDEEQDSQTSISVNHLSMASHEEDSAKQEVEDEVQDKSEDAFPEPRSPLMLSVSSPEAFFPTSKITKKQNLHRSTSWKELKYDARSSFSSDEYISSQSGAQWKSWFAEDQQLAFSCTFIEQELDTEHIEPNAIFSAQQKSSPVAYKHIKPCTILRSESSISTFRPISNNLAPRCQPQQQQSRLSTCSFLQQQNQARSPSSIKMMKSRSFPSKSALLSTFKKASSPPPVPHKEQRGPSKIRSIVNKKVSFSKIFGNRKGSSSSSSTA